MDATDQPQALALIRRGQEILGRIETLPVPTLALIHGFCLGGGLELALACRYRIASDDPATRLGFPEVKLGIHPGFGGTVRVTRLVGPLRGLELMLTGKTLSAKASRKIGLVDVVAAERHLDHAASILAADPPASRKKPLRERLATLSVARKPIGRMLRRKVAEKARITSYNVCYTKLLRVRISVKCWP